MMFIEKHGIYDERTSEDEFERMTPEMIKDMSDRFKNEFINDLLNGSGDEMVKSITTMKEQPVKFKKPLKVRYSDFKEKIKNKFIAVFGL